MDIDKLPKLKSNNHQVALHGKNCVEAELKRRGSGDVKTVSKGKSYLQVSNADGSRSVQIRVKTKTKGNWHSRIEEGTEINILSNAKDETEFWIFVDISDQSNPRFWIVVDSWIRNDIQNAHEAYLKKHNGQRRDNPGSNHHSIDEKRIQQWEGKWGNLNIFGHVPKNKREKS